MKIKFLALFFLTTIANANGVMIINAATGTYAKMIDSHVSVLVEDQVAVITTTQTFRNIQTANVTVKYAFPLTEGASATKLRWRTGSIWNTAVFTSSPQDTTLPGGGTITPNLKTYLGKTPLYFGFEQPLKADSVITVELTYVQLLNYKNGNVDFTYPNDYRLIQSTSVDSQFISLQINSQRTIDSVQLLSPSGAIITNNGLSATIQWKKIESAADANYHFRYSLHSTEVGLFGLSTNLPDSLGYFAFIVEPNPNAGVDVLKKVFTLIIDRSGSMGGDKMLQAKNAATFIVNNLNEGDKFNLIDFDDVITPFRPHHVLLTPQSRDSALLYISTISARGLTNISGAFESAIPQFASSADSATANIIIFLTDGQATAGITNTQGILTKVATLITALEHKVTIFAFGIGGDVNTQLLTMLSTQNNGIAEFLGNDELQSRITDFYLRIRNPVLINTTMDISSEKVREVFPSPLPNLYKGEQMLVAGLYNVTPPINLTFNGTAFGKPVTYNYPLSLSDTAVPKYQFLPKLWAKKKIEHLLVQYYGLPAGSAQADTVKKQIVSLSVSYGVISPFTSFTNPGTGTSVENREPKNDIVLNDFVIEGNFPNPFNPETELRFTVNKNVSTIVRIRIYNSLGQLVRQLYVGVNGPGMYETSWNGKNSEGMAVPSGTYIAVFEFQSTLLAHKMLLIK